MPQQGSVMICAVHQQFEYSELKKNTEQIIQTLAHREIVGRV